MASSWSRAPVSISDIVEEKKNSEEIELRENDRFKSVIFIK
jgi:hypothetical protein